MARDDRQESQQPPLNVARMLEQENASATTAESAQALSKAQYFGDGFRSFSIRANW
jgi:hypothetical protein